MTDSSPIIRPCIQGEPQVTRRRADKDHMPNSDRKNHAEIITGMVEKEPERPGDDQPESGTIPVRSHFLI